MELGDLLSVVADGQSVAIFVGNEELWFCSVETMPNMWDDIEVCSMRTCGDELHTEIEHG